MGVATEFGLLLRVILDSVCMIKGPSTFEIFSARIREIKNSNKRCKRQLVHGLKMDLKLRKEERNIQSRNQWLLSEDK